MAAKLSAMLVHSAVSSNASGCGSSSESAPIAPPTPNSNAAISHVNLGDSESPSPFVTSRAACPSPFNTIERA